MSTQRCPRCGEHTVEWVGSGLYCRNCDYGVEMIRVETEQEVQGTVERKPYVGDSDLIVVTCKHGDYSRMFKGATEQRGAKALAEHYAAKHGAEV